MAGEFNLSAGTGIIDYAVILAANGQFWNGSGFETYNSTNWPNYAVSIPEIPTASGYYQGSAPLLPAGNYYVQQRIQSGGSPATSDAPATGMGQLVWNGGSEVALLESSATGAFNVQGASGQTIYAVIFSSIGRFWNTNTHALEAYNASNFQYYGNPLPEINSSGFYQGSAPNLPAGTYYVELRMQAGVTPATSDTAISSIGELPWAGSTQIVGIYNVQDEDGNPSTVPVPFTYQRIINPAGGIAYSSREVTVNSGSGLAEGNYAILMISFPENANYQIRRGDGPYEPFFTGTTSPFNLPGTRGNP